MSRATPQELREAADRAVSEWRAAVDAAARAQVAAQRVQRNVAERFDPRPIGVAGELEICAAQRAALEAQRAADELQVPASRALDAADFAEAGDTLSPVELRQQLRDIEEERAGHARAERDARERFYRLCVSARPAMAGLHAAQRRRRVEGLPPPSWLPPVSLAATTIAVAAWQDWTASESALVQVPASLEEQFQALDRRERDLRLELARQQRLDAARQGKEDEEARRAARQEKEDEERRQREHQAWLDRHAAARAEEETLLAEHERCRSNQELQAMQEQPNHD